MKKSILLLAILAVISPSWADKSLGATRLTTDAPKIVVYYFHGTNRCQTCQKMETYSRQSLQSAFSKELANGSLEWRVLNFDDAANKHFINDFVLFASSLVLVQEVKGKPRRYKNLDQIYQMAPNHNAFDKYVQEELRAFIKAS